MIYKKLCKDVKKFDAIQESGYFLAMNCTGCCVKKIFFFVIFFVE